MQVNVETVKIKDIHGKDLLYVKITNGSKYEAINVGQKTFDRIQQLITTKIEKEEPKKEKK